MGRKARKVADTREKTAFDLGEALLPTVRGMIATRRCLEGVAIACGISAVRESFRQDAEVLAGPKGKMNPGRTCHHWGSTETELPLAGRRVKVTRPRGRERGGSELRLPGVEALSVEDALAAQVINQVPLGVSTRGYAGSLVLIPEEVPSRGTSKSAASRQLIKGTRARMAAFLGRRLDALDVVALLVDGIDVDGPDGHRRTGRDPRRHQGVAGALAGLLCWARCSRVPAFRVCRPGSPFHWRRPDKLFLLHDSSRWGRGRSASSGLSSFHVRRSATVAVMFHHRRASHLNMYVNPSVALGFLLLLPLAEGCHSEPATWTRGVYLDPCARGSQFIEAVAPAMGGSATNGDRRSWSVREHSLTTPLVVSDGLVLRAAMGVSCSTARSGSRRTEPDGIWYRLPERVGPYPEVMPGPVPVLSLTSLVSDVAPGETSALVVATVRLRGGHESPSWHMLQLRHRGSPGEEFQTAAFSDTRLGQEGSHMHQTLAVSAQIPVGHEVELMLASSAHVPPPRRPPMVDPATTFYIQEVHLANAACPAASADALACLD